MANKSYPVRISQDFKDRVEKSIREQKDFYQKLADASDPIIKLKSLVDEYVQSIRETGRPPKDAEEYILEAAVEMFYGMNIWKEINSKLT